MTPRNHVMASAITSSIFAFLTRSWEGTTACFLSGIFIDIDHHFDLWLYKKKILLHPKHIYQFCEREKDGKLHLIFHSYELLVIFWIVIAAFHLSFLWRGLAVGMSVHLILDQIGNALKPGVYFLFYRIKNKFSKEAIFPLGHFKNKQ